MYCHCMLKRRVCVCHYHNKMTISQIGYIDFPIIACCGGYIEAVLISKTVPSDQECGQMTYTQCKMAHLA